MTIVGARKSRMAVLGQFDQKVRDAVAPRREARIIGTLHLSGASRRPLPDQRGEMIAHANVR